MPVVDATTLPNLGPGGNSQLCNLLLLWSMFFVAANYVSADLWKLEDLSRKEMKHVIYSPTKVRAGVVGILFWLIFGSVHPSQCWRNRSHSSPTISTATGILPLGFRYSYAAMNWLGIAISLFQSIALHRVFSPACADLPILRQQQRLWRRLWWMCSFRNSWLSLIMGRPLGINLNDCSTDIPTANDMLITMHDGPPVFRGIFLEAIRQIFLGYVTPSPAPELATTSGPSPTQDALADDPIAGMAIGEDTIDALMDDVSTFNFWELINSMQAY